MATESDGSRSTRRTAKKVPTKKPAKKAAKTAAEKNAETAPKKTAGATATARSAGGRQRRDVAARTPGDMVTRIRAKVDPLGWAPALATVTGRALANPTALAGAAARGLGAALALPGAAALRALTGDGPTPVPGVPSDRRFSAAAYQQNAYFFTVQQVYALIARYVEDVLDAGSRDDIDDLKARLATGLLLDGMAPTNFLLTNPTALIRAFETGGRSLVNGTRMALEDLRDRKGLPMKVDRSLFTVGENLACTAGRVVLRNDLIELIQYEPRTEQVHEVPLLCSPPWINKYYVMDLAPGRSFVEWAVEHGRTVFMISYRNPDESMRDVTMDDYLVQGLLTALDAVGDITGAEHIDVAALCLGGAMAGIGAAHEAARGAHRLGSLTLFNTMLDYAQPGELRGFVDEGTLRRVEARMGETGFLESGDMALAFDLLRARDLIFRYIPERWLQGNEPAAFDILAWNEDATRMPAAMHSTYLRSLYGENLLAKGEFELAGERLDPGTVTADTYVVGAINDHIVPWKASYAATRLLGGKVRYVLSSGGHIAGIVNPPSPKAWFEASDVGAGYPGDPDRWREVAEHRSGSWWEDWIAWSSARAGTMIAPPPMGSSRYPAGEAAPGSYVRM